MGIVVFRLSHLCVTLNRIAPPLPRCVKQRPDQEASLLACFQGSLHVLSQASPWDAHCLCFVLLTPPCRLLFFLRTSPSLLHGSFLPRCLRACSLSSRAMPTGSASSGRQAPLPPLLHLPAQNLPDLTPLSCYCGWRGGWGAEGWAWGRGGKSLSRRMG